MKISKKLLNIIFTTIFACSCSLYTGDLNATIPEFNGLYTLFTKENDTTPALDTIGIGQSLLYSNWLENVYAYAPEDNAARKVISILWNKRLYEGPHNALVFTETNNFIPSEHDPIKGFNGKDIGMLIRYIRNYNKSNDQKSRPKFSVNCSGKNKKELINNLFVSLEDLKFNTNFIPEMAECILWAFFENKTNLGEQEFKECLNEIDPKLLKKLENKQTQENFYTIDATKDLSIIKNTANNLMESENNIDNLLHYDALTNYLIKFVKNKTIPTKVLQTKSKCIHPLTGIKSEEEFPTCFESSLLDVLSILFFDPANKKYDPNILPESVKNGETFKNLIDQVFKTLPKDNLNSTDKEFIQSKDINTRIQAWINLISNLPELKYKNNYENSYDLNPSFENFVKVLNKFLDLKFAITDKKDTLEINYYNNNNDIIKITVQKGKPESWQTLFDIISDKLSTKENNNIKRPVKFVLEDEENSPDTKFEKTNKTDSYSICTGTIKIIIGDTKLNIITSPSHAKLVCLRRDKYDTESNFHNTKNNDLEKLKKQLIDTKITINNKNLIPLLMFSPGIQITKNNPQIEALLYYSINLKDQNTKLDFLKEIFNSSPETIKNIYKNQDIQKLVSKLINLLPENDEYLIRPLSKYLDKKHAVHYWQEEIESKITEYIKKTIPGSEKSINNSVEYFSKVLPFLSLNNINEFLKNQLTRIFQNQTLRNNNKETLLHIALRDGLKIFAKKILLNNTKIDVNAKNKEKETPLSIALKKCISNNEYTNIIKILLNHSKIDVNIKNKNGETPLHQALENFSFSTNFKDIIKMLLNHSKIDVNAKNKNGQTPLHTAIAYGSTWIQSDIIKMLIEHPKIDIKIKNNDGETAMMIAMKLKDKKTIEMLKNKEIEEGIESIKNSWLFINA